MSKEQIEEMARVVAEVQYLGGLEEKVAERLYNAGYRKQIKAEWIICSDGYYPYCSVCKNEPKNGVMTDYCPNCGARMSGGNNDE